MTTRVTVILAALLAAAFCLNAQTAKPAPARAAFEGQLKMIEGEFVPLVEAMPEDKFGFSPKEGEFKGARTFSQQATHVAAILYMVGASLKGEKNPTDVGESENGPANLKTKADVVKYVKDAFAYARQSLSAVNDQNALEMAPSPFGQGTMPRISVASVLIWHSFDHYGQMAVYARMCGVIPPASRR